MGEYRRMKRKMERDIKKKGRMLNIPTEKDVEEYIINKTNQQYTPVEILEPQNLSLINGKEEVRS